MSSLGLGGFELGLSERSLGGLSSGSDSGCLLNGLLNLRDSGGLLGGLLGGGSGDEVGLLLLVRRALDLLEERTKDRSALGGLGLLSGLLGNLLVLLNGSRSDNGSSSLGLNRGRSSSLSNDGSGSRLSLQLITSLGDVRGDDGSSGGGLADLGSNRLLLLDLSLSSGLLSLVFLAEETTKDAGTLAANRAALALVGLLLVLLLSVGGRATGRGSSTGGASGLSSAGLGVGRPGNVDALLGGGGGSGSAR